MQELIGLGIDTSKASAFYYPNYGDYYEHPITKKYVRDVKDYNPYPSFVNGDRILKDLNPDLFPTFTLQDLLEMLPKSIPCEELEEYGENTHLVVDVNTIMYCDLNMNIVYGACAYGNSILEAAFNMLKWCKQNNYV